MPVTDGGRHIRIRSLKIDVNAGVTSWQSIDVKQVLSVWLRQPETNWGIEINAYDAKGNDLAVTSAEAGEDGLVSWAVVLPNVRFLHNTTAFRQSSASRNRQYQEIIWSSYTTFCFKSVISQKCVHIFYYLHFSERATPQQNSELETFGTRYLNEWFFQPGSFEWIKSEQRDHCNSVLELTILLT